MQSDRQEVKAAPASSTTAAPAQQQTYRDRFFKSFIDCAFKPENSPEYPCPSLTEYRVQKCNPLCSPCLECAVIPCVCGSVVLAPFAYLAGAILDCCKAMTSCCNAEPDDQSQYRSAPKP